MNYRTSVLLHNICIQWWLTRFHHYLNYNFISILLIGNKWKILVFLKIISIGIFLVHQLIIAQIYQTSFIISNFLSVVVTNLMQVFWFRKKFTFLLNYLVVTLSRKQVSKEYRQTIVIVTSKEEFIPLNPELLTSLTPCQKNKAE